MNKHNIIHPVLDPAKQPDSEVAQGSLMASSEVGQGDPEHSWKDLDTVEDSTSIIVNDNGWMELSADQPPNKVLKLM